MRFPVQHSELDGHHTCLVWIQDNHTPPGLQGHQGYHLLQQGNERRVNASLDIHGHAQDTAQYTSGQGSNEKVNRYAWLLCICGLLMKTAIPVPVVQQSKL